MLLQTEQDMTLERFIAEQFDDFLSLFNRVIELMGISSVVGEIQINQAEGIISFDEVTIAASMCELPANQRLLDGKNVNVPGWQISLWKGIPATSVSPEDCQEVPVFADTSNLMICKMAVQTFLNNKLSGVIDREADRMLSLN